MTEAWKEEGRWGKGPCQKALAVGGTPFFASGPQVEALDTTPPSLALRATLSNPRR